MNKKTQLIISLLAGFAAAIMIAGYVSSIKNKYKSGARKVPVIVTTKYVDAGEMLSPNDIELREVPQDYLQPRALQKIEDLITEKGYLLYMAAVPIDRGEQVVGTKLFPLGDGTGIGSVVPAGMRAVTVIMDRGEVGRTILPGNRADVLATFDYYDEKGVRHEETQTILQNVPILAVGKAIIGTVREIRVKTKQTAAAALAADDEHESRIPVSIAVTPGQAELFILAKNKGAIDIILRAVGDDAVFALEGASMKKIFQMYGGKGKASGPQTEYLRALQKQQDEALKMLQRYRQ